MRRKIIVCLMLLSVAFTTSAAAACPNAAESAALSEYIAGEAEDAPFAVHLAMAAALLNRLGSGCCPPTVSGMLSMLGYRTCRHTRAYDFARSAVRAAAEGMDITNGATEWAKSNTEKAARLTVTFRVEDWVFGREK